MTQVRDASWHVDERLGLHREAASTRPFLAVSAVCAASLLVALGLYVSDSGSAAYYFLIFAVIISPQAVVHFVRWRRRQEE